MTSLVRLFGVTLPTIFFLMSSFPLAQADESAGLLSDSQWAESRAQQGYLLAQYGEDDTYDPFADYSEFEDNYEEESDINFFRHGRFFTLGFMLGQRLPTNNLSDIYDNATPFGLYLTYFFDLRFALQLTWLTGDHDLKFTTSSGTTVRGNASISSVSMNLKYYINTQNITRGLAKLNPYLIGGFSQVNRDTTVSGESAFSKDGALGFEFGGGLEWPLMRNKMFVGAQLTYLMVTFPDENSEIRLASEGNAPTGIVPKGDLLNLALSLGINF